MKKMIPSATAVAHAAPSIPHPSLTINSQSSAILTTANVTSAAEASRGRPSTRTK
jgi:hypothetical protein